MAIGPQKPICFLKGEKYEEHSSNCVDGSDRTRLNRSGEGGERNMLSFRRLLCLLFRLR
jgi:hypothetical protein